MAVAVGALTAGVLATVDERGGVRASVAGRPVAVGWRVHAGNRWLDPASEPSARAARPGVAPLARTALRVPGGDAVHRVYALGSHGGTLVIEVENASPTAVGVAFTTEPGDAASVLSLPRPPGAVEADGSVVFPVPHRTAVRVALAHAPVDVRALDDAASVERAWRRVLDRGMRTELPDEVQASVDAARADALLAPPSAAAFVVLEAWGFDAEAAAMWERLGSRARRAARRRAVEAGMLGEIRDALVCEHGREILLLPGFDRGWLGQHLAVHDAPGRRGPVSFALRWHGARPALLWDVPPGSLVRAPALDPQWSSSTAAGEALLSEPAVA
jgi:hypothetical protein